MILVWVLVSCLNDSCTGGIPAVPVNPSDTEVRTYLGDCLPGTEIRTMCQSCARMVKTSRAYGMCCRDEAGNSTESVRDFCRRFLHHTVGSSDSRLERPINKTLRPVG
uniref:Putative conserved secreted protein n=1 Tax=Ornithodoros turicata TaxID=34597 RepID=A0A2R5LJ44_9ACAR